MTALANAQAIAQQLPRDQARVLRTILSLRASPSRHRALIIGSRLPIGALVVADTFHGVISERTHRQAHG